MAVARIALPVAVPHAFDYWIPDGLDVRRGSVVRVRLGNRSSVGVIVGVDAASEVADRLQPIDEVVEGLPITEEILDLAEFAGRYYQAAPGLALELAVPPAAKARSLRRRAAPDAAPDARTAVALNPAQESAAQEITAALGSFGVFVLHGVTGSGKTEVYLAAAKEAVARGGQVLMLMPEINLTPQFEQRIRLALPGAQAVTLHSGLAAGARRANWDAAASGAAQIVVGTRLAVFTPLPGLALVVVDEEHDDSFKQQEGVRYHARDLAILRAQRRGVPVVLGSATPSLETWAGARAGRYRTLELPLRADPRAQPPAIAFVPVRGSRAQDGISTPLLDALAQRLARGEQSLLFINRRGYAPSLKCASCTWESGCPRCAARLVVHHGPDRLRCHHCAHVERLPRACPQCGNVDLTPLGFGTQRLEQAIRARFPQARVARVDRDTTARRGAFARVRQQIEDLEVDILVGTQMLAKGHDFPRLTLVGVLGADNALYSADFRATERLVALLMQVAGRAGRADLPGQVIVQTDFPDHPVYRALATQDYGGFADELLAEREAAQLPPVTRVALLAAEAHSREDVDRFLATAFARAQALAGDAAGVEIFPPVPAAIARKAGFERGQVLVQCTQRSALQAFLARWREDLASRAGTKLRWTIDVDPVAF
jgi:primosomal protein N' (replication factor Y)